VDDVTRATFFRLHSWLGIATGACMLAIAWSGSLVVFNDEIEWLLNPAARADPARGQLPVDAIAEAIRARHPDRRFALHFQIGPRWSHTAYVYDGRQQRLLQIDPATAAILADHAMVGYTFNVGYFLRQLHVRLLMGFWGRVFVGLFGVTLVLSVLTSLVVYRDWRRSLFRIRRDHGRRILYMDLHKAVGAWSLLFSLMFGVTGAVLGLENLYFRLWPAAPPPPVIFPTAPALASPMTPGQALSRVAGQDGRFRPTSIDVPPEGPIVVRGDYPRVFVAEGASEYAVHRTTGAVRRTVDARRLRWRAYLYNVLDPLHFGYFGERLGPVPGYAIELLWAVAGLAPGVLAMTGGVMWLERRRRRAAGVRAAGNSAPVNAR
jgi:uncharacterized iron-regulated membrane protein